MRSKININKLSVRQLRQRCFVRRSKALFGSDYTFTDDVPEQIEKLEGFTKWETFSEEWDVYWVGLDPRTLQWISGRHNSPARELVLPIRIVPIDDRNGRMIDTAEDKKDVRKMPVPFKEPLPESEEDRIISESLSGKVVIDESDKDKAIRVLNEQLQTMQKQLEVLQMSK